ncbi:7064_t:CDS:2 [Gigaspora margarita]|uniref:7064_t:CDS:1 n=1 Tax=Gigaspora margarita TaxID=4874 RepID=A0ABN7UFY3_GIGMA|nr:7064_t:CDS:2 [Gigaspora margarita]
MPHQTACDILDVNQLNAMAQIHSYYITNASELNYINQGLSDEELENTIADVIYVMFIETDLFNNEDDEKGLENLSSNINVDNSFSNIDIMLENNIDITSVLDNLDF